MSKPTHYVRRWVSHHPVFGTSPRTSVGCGRQWSPTINTTTDKSEVTCQQCRYQLGLKPMKPSK